MGDEARFVPIRHDPGTKTILGRTGAFDADGLARLLLEHPATSRRLAWRLCHEFFGEGAVDEAAIDALAEGLRAHDLDIGWGVATVLRSRRFFDPANLGHRVSSPIEYAVGAVRALEMFDPSPSTPVLADWCGRLGQDLFDPPNVGGWPGGRAWITTRSAIGRANFAAALIGGESVGLSTPFDPIATGRPARPGRRPAVLRATAARRRWPRGPARRRRAGPERPGPAPVFSRGPADLMLQWHGFQRGLPTRQDARATFSRGETVTTRRDFLARGLRDSSLIALAPDAPRLPRAPPAPPSRARTTASWSSSSSTAATTASTRSSPSRTTGMPSTARRSGCPRSG